MNKSRKQLRTERLRAFEGVVAEYEGRLLRYASRIVHDPDAAQDLVQESFIKLFRKWEDQMRPCPQISSWLYRVTHNGAVDLLRKETRRRELHQRHSEETPVSVPPNRGRGFRISEEAARADAALAVLSLREQQLVVLKVYEEKSYKEISEITRLSVGNVGYILHHAMRKLSEELRKANTT